MGEGTTVTPRSREKVDEALLLIESIRAAGAMGDDVYHKCLVSLAYEYTLVDEDEEALILIVKVPTSYYESVQFEQMEADSLYQDTVVRLAYKLIQMGVVEGSDKLYVPTMPKASA